MLYSETELKKRLKSGCPVFYFYASDEALVRSAAAKAEKFLSEEAPDTTTLDGPTPSVEDIVLAAGNTRQALAKLQTLLELQNEPILITGALIGNYLDIYRAFLAKKSRRPLADLAKDFKYTGKWNYRLGNADQTAARFQRSQIEESLRILQKLDLDLKGSRLDAPLLMQKAICELSLARSRA